MTQPDVTLTDYGLSAECVLFCWLIFCSPAAAHPKVDAISFFLSLAIAAGTGGTVHGFFLDERTRGYKVLWRFTLVMIGVSAFFGLRVGAAILMPTTSSPGYVNTVGGLFLLIYICIALIFWQDYKLAIIGYFPSIPWLFMAFLVEFHRQGRVVPLAGCLGIGTMVIAAAVQQLKVAVNRRYFDHNALYHVLQAAGLWMVFVAIRP